MALPAILMGIGTGMQVFSQWMANLDQQQAEYENAKFYQEQSDLARSQMNRDLDISDREYEARKGATIGAEAASGADVGSGSAVINIAAVAAAKIKELSAIKLQGEMNMKIASLRAKRSNNAGDTLGNTGYNVAQGLTTILGNAAKSDGFGTGFNWPKPNKSTSKDQNITGAPNYNEVV